MSKKEIKVTFNTLTPLWTGDAWGENKEIRPSSIMGSLRFWFEIICYFSSITSYCNYDSGKLNDNLDERKFREKIFENGMDFKGIDKFLAECKVSLPSRVFGCTGWKGWVRIKTIQVTTEDADYDFPIGKIKFEELKYKKQYFNKKANKKKEEKEITPTWYFQKGFKGTFEIIFEVEEKILETIFFPLLKFIEKYGFLGGKWNIGYGRVKVESVSDEKWDSNFADKNDDEIKFKFTDSNSIRLSELINEKNSFSTSTQAYNYLKFFLNTKSFYCSCEKNFRDNISDISNDIRVAKLNNNFSDFQNAIKELLKIKAKMRNCLRPDNSIKEKQVWHNFRHILLGTTSGGLEGTKIIPWIYKENEQLEGGFISIAGIINL